MDNATSGATRHPRGRPLAERMEAWTDKSGGPDACWPWTGPHNPGGYGHLKVGTRTMSAHRIAAGAHDLGPDRVVMHTCDNPPCCNPAHLRIGTVAENNADMSAKGRATSAKGSAHYRARLTDSEVVAVRARVAAGEQQDVVAVIHGLDRRHVSQIVRRIIWKHVP